MHTVLQPSLLRIGAGASRTLPSVLHGLNLHRPLLVTDDFIKRSGVLGKIESDLSDAGLHHSTFAECTPDPTTSVVSAGLAAWHASPHRPDCVVGIGGGSPIDTAKAIAVLATAPADAALRSYKVPSAPPSGVPIVAVPTTAGTGSEATRATVISDVETGEKMLIMGSSLMPIAALVDFELTLTKPSRLTADTAVDALCHAMEAYVSRRRNPYSDAHALAAMRTIPRYVRLACEKPDDREAREALMLAATQAGIAFSNSSVTLIHGMSRPLGAHFHVPHGMSNAMLLPAVTAFSISGAPERYADCARAMGLVAPSTDDDVAACAALVAGLERLCVDLKVSTPDTRLPLPPLAPTPSLFSSPPDKPPTDPPLSISPPLPPPPWPWLSLPALSFHFSFVL